MLKNKIKITKCNLFNVFLLGNFASLLLVNMLLNNMLAGLSSAIGFLLTLIIIYSNS